jgi:hypothetical protein
MFVGEEKQDAVLRNYVLGADIRVTGTSQAMARGGDQARMMVNVSGSRARGSSGVALSPAPYVIQATGPGGAPRRLNAFLQPRDGTRATHLPSEPPTTHRPPSTRHQSRVVCVLLLSWQPCSLDCAEARTFTTDPPSLLTELRHLRRQVLDRVLPR